MQLSAPLTSPACAPWTVYPLHRDVFSEYCVVLFAFFFASCACHCLDTHVQVMCVCASSNSTTMHSRRIHVHSFMATRAESVMRHTSSWHDFAQISRHNYQPCHVGCDLRFRRSLTPCMTFFSWQNHVDWRTLIVVCQPQQRCVAYHFLQPLYLCNTSYSQHKPCTSTWHSTRTHFSA
jgi:hypothetical protein